MTDAAKFAQAVLAHAGKPWFKIEPQNATGSKTRAKVYVYAPIGTSFWMESVEAGKFAKELDELDVEEIELHVNSPGGSAFDGTAIRNALVQHPAKVTTYVDGLAASAASYIALAGDEVIMAPGSMMMIHDASGACWGDAKDMAKTGQVLDKLSNSIAGLYALKAGGDAATWRAAMLEETWYSAEEAVEAGLADRVEAVEDEEGGAGDASNFQLRSFFAYAGRDAAPDPHQVAPATFTHTLPTASAAGSTPPVAAASGDTTQEGGAVADITDAQLTTLRQTAGVADDADVDTIVAAIQEALEEQAEPTATPQNREGIVTLDQATYDAMRADAAAGREARNEQLTARRTGLVDAAVRDGRIAPARRQHWLDQLTADPGASEVLASLQPGTIPVNEVGHAIDAPDSTDPLESVSDEALERFAASLGVTKEALRG